MKIIKQPVFETITCKRCGTVFVPEAEDDIICTGVDAEGVNTLEIECPTCAWFYRCKTIGFEC